MKADELVWYVAYGPALLEEYLQLLIEGGEDPESGQRFAGLRDSTPPRAERAVFLPHRLFFARRSPVWQRGGVAFLDARRDDAVHTLGRAWLLTAGQCEDLLRQENRDPDLCVDWSGLRSAGRWEAPRGWYRRLLLVEAEREGHPVITATAAEDDLCGRCQPPGDRYLGVVVAGLVETYRLGRAGLVSYLAPVGGVAGAWSKGAVGRLWQDVIAAEAAADSETLPNQN